MKNRQPTRARQAANGEMPHVKKKNTSPHTNAPFLQTSEGLGFRVHQASMDPMAHEKLNAATEIGAEG